jgi:hypothetical protein
MVAAAAFRLCWCALITLQLAPDEENPQHLCAFPHNSKVLCLEHPIEGGTLLPSVFSESFMDECENMSPNDLWHVWVVLGNNRVCSFTHAE